MRWAAKPWSTVQDYRRWFAWYPVRVEYPDKAEWVWLEWVETLQYVSEGRSTLRGRR